MHWLLTIFIVLIFLDTSAQETLKRCQKIEGNTLITSSHIVLYQSISINSIGPSQYSIDSLTAKQFKIILDSAIVSPVQLCYTVLPAIFSRVFSFDSTRYYDSTAMFTFLDTTKIKKGYADKRQELFDLGELSRSGKISRGIVAGNTQDLSVNSSLNLNIEGKLSDDLNIKASITDQSIPLQSEGNTQQLQDFDKVFIQLFNDQFSILGGDVVLKSGSSHFLKYTKNVLGGKIDYSTKQSTSSFGASEARGQFSSQEIKIKEGLYGPYKVPAPDNLSFIIIIANSEKVYLDEKLLLRGYDNEYTIDYNQAEIEFTNNVILTKHSRVKVEYEYLLKSYARSVITGTHTQKIGNLELGVNFFQEKDSKNKPLFRALSDDDKQQLSNIGDSLQQAIIPGETRVEFSDSRILYYKKDTLTSKGVVESIFIHTTSFFPTVYTVQFTNVGVGKGNYEIAKYLAQGRTYKWVGDGNGSYLPYILLVAPNKKQMITVTGNTPLGAYTTSYIEVALSQFDKNTYSTMDSHNNNGQAFLIGAKADSIPLLSDYLLSSTIEAEYLSNNFTIIERFRKVGFDRSWAIAQEDELINQDFNLKTELLLKKDNLNFISYSTIYRKKQQTFHGFQHNIGVSKSLGIFQVNGNGFFMNGKMPLSLSSWRNFSGEIYLKGKIKPGYKYIIEQNLMKNIHSDSIISSKDYYREHQFFVRSAFATNTNIELLYSKRNDKLPQQGALKESTKSETITAKLKSQINSNHSLNFILNYRLLTNKIQTTPSIQNISGRIDWVGTIIPKTIRSELRYNIANLSSPKREYVFIEVPTGEGTHAWRDENEDEVKDLKEFYEAFNYDEKRFIKLYVPSNTFIDAFENRFNYRLSLNFPIPWSKEEGIKKLVSKISSTSSLTTQYSTTENSFSARFIPFIATIDTSKLLSSKNYFRSTLFINKSSPIFGVNIGYLSRSRKQLYINGYEARKTLEYTTVLRWNTKQKIYLELKGGLTETENDSDYLKDRNYEIKSEKMEPLLAWQPTPNFRISTAYKYELSKQVNKELLSNALLNEASAELRLGTATKFVFNTTFKYSHIIFNGKAQSPIGYELLKGLKQGNNFSIILHWQQKLINGLQIQLFYEGRKPENTLIIHSVRAGISALF